MTNRKKQKHDSTENNIKSARGQQQHKMDCHQNPIDWESTVWAATSRTTLYVTFPWHAYDLFHEKMKRTTNDNAIVMTK